ICAVTTEAVAAQAFFNEEHTGPRKVAQSSNNSYILSKVSSHDVVITTLPDGQYSTTLAAAVAGDMLYSFSNVRIGLIASIRGGVAS
ncbi:hypothetical protein LZ30DRAFT_607750, partial [Colletotrichum cereale]